MSKAHSDKDFEANLILHELAKKNRLTEKAKSYRMCGISYLLISCAFLSLYVFQPNGWISSSVVLLVILAVVRFEIQGVNSRIDSLLLLHEELEKRLDKPLNHRSEEDSCMTGVEKLEIQQSSQT